MDKKSNIKRRNFIKNICLGAIGGAAMVNFPLLFTKEERKIKSPRPNIILIVVDDQIK